MSPGPGSAPRRYLLVAGLYVPHVVLLQPAAGVLRVPVGRPVQRGAHVGAGPAAQQLLPARVQPHEAAQVVQAAAAGDQAGALRAARPHLGGAEGPRPRRGHGPAAGPRPAPLPVRVPVPSGPVPPPRSARTCSSAYMHVRPGHAPRRAPPQPIGQQGRVGHGWGGEAPPQRRYPGKWE